MVCAARSDKNPPKVAGSLIPHQVTLVVERSRRTSTFLRVLLSDPRLLQLPLVFRQGC